MNENAVPSLSAQIAKRTVASFQGVRAICPHCGAISAFIQIETTKWTSAEATAFEGLVEAVIMGRCPGCGRLVLAVSLLTNSGTVGKLLWPPCLPPDRSPPTLEPDCKEIYDQARRVLELSPMATALLARRCLQHVLTTRLKITKKSLFGQIAEAVKSDELSNPTRGALDHVRKIGNWSAHPTQDEANEIVEVTPQEAEYTLGVLELLFNDLYLVPENISKMHANIHKKK